MKKLLVLLPFFFILMPVEAGVRGEGEPRCKRQGKVIVCRMPRHRKPKRCRMMPCIPPGYYRPNPPRVIPMR